MISLFGLYSQIGGAGVIRATIVAPGFGQCNLQDREVSDSRVVSIIDDDDSIRTAIDDLVSSLGLVAHTYQSAEDFLSSTDRDATSCIICDLQMPGMSGQDLQCRLIAEGHHTPMIFITAFPETRVRECVLAKGALAFLEKPFDGGKLVSLIRSAVEAH
jgi:FixJ family two-component response regulator